MHVVDVFILSFDIVYYIVTLLRYFFHSYIVGALTMRIFVVPIYISVVNFFLRLSCSFSSHSRVPVCILQSRLNFE